MGKTSVCFCRVVRRPAEMRKGVKLGVGDVDLDVKMKGIKATSEVTGLITKETFANLIEHRGAEDGSKLPLPQFSIRRDMQTFTHSSITTFRSLSFNAASKRIILPDLPDRPNPTLDTIPYGFVAAEGEE